MKVNQFVALMKRNGCFLLRHGGRHDVWFSPKTNQSFSVPRHSSKELLKGIEAEGRKALGLKD